MDTLAELFQKCDVITLITIFVAFYVYDSRMQKKFEAVDKKFEAIDRKFEGIDHKLDKIREDIQDVDRRLCRLEGAFASKDCCMIKDSSQLRKAE